MTALFMLLQTWQSVVIKVMLSEYVVCSTIGSLSNSCTSCYCKDDDSDDDDDDDDELVFCSL